MEIGEILGALERNTGKFPFQAIEAAIEAREEITPELLRILEYTNANAAQIVAEDPDSTYFAHLHAIYLLAQFREVRAYPLMLQFARIETDTLDFLTGDFVSQDLCRVLASVCDGDVRPIEELVEDRGLDEYVRSAGLESLVTLVAMGDIARDDVMAYFKGLFEGRLERTDTLAWNVLVACSVDLHPGEVAGYIAAAYEEDLVDPAFVSPGEVERELKRDLETVLDDLRRKNRGYIRNVAEDIQWWACFDQP